MRLNIDALVRYAEDNALRNDYELSQELGIKSYLIHAASKGQKIGYEEVKEFYNRNGESLTVELVNFEEETLDGFKAKYVQIGNKLY